MDVTSECDLFNYDVGHRVNLFNYFSVIQKNGGGGGNRTRVPKTELIAFYKFSQIIISRQYHFVH